MVWIFFFFFKWGFEFDYGSVESRLLYNYSVNLIKYVYKIMDAIANEFTI